MTKALVLLSGGIDSAVCLRKALQQHSEVEAIHFDYGQQTEHIERRNAQKQCREKDVELEIVDYRDVFSNFAEGTVRDKEYNSSNTVEDEHSVGYVPQRNLHLLTSAAAKAEHHSETGEEIFLYIGVQSGDAGDYPDCRPEFMELAEKTINQATEQHEFNIETPLISRSKEEVLELGQELGVTWELTFSCYNDENENPCGECPACIEREEAFQKIDFDDPIRQE
ncbi:MAG: 7-cyano-7-deazaguanine synthase [Candidatus Nanohalobium sp.]